MPHLHGDATARPSGDYLHRGSSQHDELVTCSATRHGTDDAYVNADCRCPEARADHARARNHRHLRLALHGPMLVPGIGTARRLQALAAIGYSVIDIATAIGTRPSYVGQLQHRVDGRVRRETAAKVRVVYNRHADSPGPSPHAIHYARRNGWLSPLWWDDDTIDNPSHQPRLTDDPHRDRRDIDPVIVDRLVDGMRISATPAERFAAYLRLRDGGHSGRTIARQLGLSGLTLGDYQRRADARDYREEASA